MLSARELALEQNPSATGWVNQRIIYTHGIGAAMVPVNEVAQRGPAAACSSATCRRSRRAGAPDDHRAAHLLRRAAELVRRRRRPAGRVRLPDRRGRRAAARSGPRRAGPGRPGSRSTTTLMRLLFALRFRDLDLLISDQVTADSQLLFHRSLTDRLPRIAPFLRFDKDPYLVIDDAGRLVYVQDAYTTSRPLPERPGLRPGALARRPASAATPFNYIRNSVKITSTPTTARCTSTSATRTTRSSAPTRASSRRCSSRSSAMPADLRAAPARPGGAVQRPDPHVRALPRHRPAAVLPARRPVDGADRPDERADAPVRGLLRRMRLPGETGVEFLLLQPMVPTEPAEHDRLGRRPDGRAELRRGRRSTGSRPTRRSSGPAQIEARIDQDPLISAQISLWNQSGSNVIRGNLIVVPLDDSLIYLQPVYLQSTGSAFPEFQRIVVASPRQVVWGETLGEALACCSAAEAGRRTEPVAAPTPAPSPSPDARPTPARRPADAGADAGDRPLPTDVPGLIDYANAPLRARPDGAARRRLRPLRRGDRARRGGPPAARRSSPRSSALPSAAAIGQPGAVTRGAALGRRRCSSRSRRPATWPLALAAFLLRGGIVLFVAADRRAADAGRPRQRRSGRPLIVDRARAVAAGVVADRRGGRSRSSLALAGRRRLARRAGARGRADAADRRRRRGRRRAGARRPTRPSRTAAVAVRGSSPPG